MNLDEVPKKTQYIVLDSTTLDITGGEFTVDLSLESNLHMEDMSRVIGFKVVDFYAMNIGKNDSGYGNGNKYINIICDDIPKRAQLLDEREGHVLERIPTDRYFTGTTNDLVWRDKQWQPWVRKTNYFNPISIQKLHFRMMSLEGNGDYRALRDTRGFYMIVEVATIDVKEKPKDREIQILQALNSLNDKIALLNENIIRIPTKEEEEEMKKKKIPFVYLMIFALAIMGGYLFLMRQKNV